MLPHAPFYWSSVDDYCISTEINNEHIYRRILLDVCHVLSL
jgi:hypothetical protein